MAKSVLILAATSLEITPFIEQLRETKGRIGPHNIDVLIGGVGLLSTAYYLTRQLLIKKPSLVIQAGVAGCFDKKIALGTVVMVKKDLVADESVVENGELKSIFDLQLASPGKFPFSKGWLVNDSKILSLINSKKVNAISVNQVTTSPQMIRLYNEKFNAVIESMEGAALHFTCLQENVPFLQLRAISNYVGERNKANWKMKEAIRQLNNELLNLLEHKL